jgi:ferredoxin
LKQRGPNSARDTALPLPVLTRRWDFPRGVPTFEQLTLDRTVTRTESNRPLASTEVTSPRVNDAAVRAVRVTSDDPSALLSRGVHFDALVVNLVDVEADPALQLAWALANQEKLATAIDTLAAQLKVSRVVVASYANAPASWLNTLRALCIARPGKTTLAEVPPRYPVAFARLLHRHLRFKRRERVLTLDAIALIEIGHLRREASAPLLVPVAIRTASTTHYHTVARGARLARVLTALDIDHTAATVLAGPAMRGVGVDQSVALDGAGELAFHIVPLPAGRIAEPCIRCGWCAEVCPAALAPITLFDAALRRDSAALERDHVRACVDCGLCTAICPAQLPLHDAFAPRLPVGGDA